MPSIERRYVVLLLQDDITTLSSRRVFSSLEPTEGNLYSDLEPTEGNQYSALESTEGHMYSGLKPTEGNLLYIAKY